MNKRGFTLIEIMVVLFILALLGSIAIYSFVRVHNRAVFAVDQGNAAIIINAVNAHNRLAGSEIISDDLIEHPLPASIDDFNKVCYVDIKMEPEQYLYAAAYIDFSTLGNAVFDETNPSAR